MSKINIKDEKGFTLLDTMISVAVFSVICIFIAQIAIYTVNTNKKSKELDKASLIALSSLEDFKSLNSPYDFFNTEFIRGTQINIGAEYFLFDKNTLSDTEFNETIIIYKYYDSNFQHLYNAFEENPLESIENEEIKYIQYFYIYSKNETEGFTFVNSGESLNISGEMYNIRTNIEIYGADSDESQLVNYSTKKYFVNNEYL